MAANLLRRHNLTFICHPPPTPDYTFVAIHHSCRWVVGRKRWDHVSADKIKNGRDFPGNLGGGGVYIIVSRVPFLPSAPPVFQYWKLLWQMSLGCWSSNWWTWSCFKPVSFGQNVRIISNTNVQNFWKRYIYLQLHWGSSGYFLPFDYWNALWVVEADIN